MLRSARFPPGGLKASVLQTTRRGVAGFPSRLVTPFIFRSSLCPITLVNVGAEPTIKRLELRDAPEYAAFAARNRQFMTRFDPNRPDEFFTTTGQQHRIGQLLAQGDWLGWIATADNQVVGQVSLNNIVRGAFQSAHIGYSIDEHYQGRGIATDMVRLAVTEGLTRHGLHRIEAGTLLDNVGSQTVLKRIGFEEIGVSRFHLHIGGEWAHHRLFSITAEILLGPDAVPRDRA